MLAGKGIERGALRLAAQRHAAELFFFFFFSFYYWSICIRDLLYLTGAALNVIRHHSNEYILSEIFITCGILAKYQITQLIIYLRYLQFYILTDCIYVIFPDEG